MFLTIKKKVLIVCLCVLVVFSVVGIYFGVRATMTKPNVAPVVVVDAGHGGIDGGAEGDFANESELNLKYSLTLKEKLEQYGFRVVLTRKDMAGLYSPLASNKKRSEMEKRKKIIEKAKAAFVISVHMNSFSSANVRGAQVFYANGSVGGQALAESVQTRLNQNLDYAKVTAKVGDYYILNCTDNPSILIECGFLSNPEEEQLLMREDYRNKFCYNVLCGLLSYYAFD